MIFGGSATAPRGAAGLPLPALHFTDTTVRPPRRGRGTDTALEVETILQCKLAPTIKAGGRSTNIQTARAVCQRRTTVRRRRQLREEWECRDHRPRFAAKDQVETVPTAGERLKSTQSGPSGHPSRGQQCRPNARRRAKWDRHWIATVLIAQAAVCAALGIAAQLPGPGHHWLNDAPLRPEVARYADDVADFQSAWRGLGQLFGVSL
jgi:hypothetical protein